MSQSRIENKRPRIFNCEKVGLNGERTIAVELEEITPENRARRRGINGKAGMEIGD